MSTPCPQKRGGLSPGSVKSIPAPIITQMMRSTPPPARNLRRRRKIEPEGSRMRLPRAYIYPIAIPPANPAVMRVKSGSPGIVRMAGGVQNRKNRRGSSWSSLLSGRVLRSPIPAERRRATVISRDGERDPRRGESHCSARMNDTRMTGPITQPLPGRRWEDVHPARPVKFRCP